MRQRLIALLTALGLVFSGVAVQAGPVAAYAPRPSASSLTDAPPDIPAENVMAHLERLQAIASEHSGNRAHGNPGYRASADYVKAQLDAAGYTTTLQPFTYRGATGWNVIAEWPHGDPDQVVFAGAHLDGVPAGPVINDNGSGSAAVLEVALAVSRAGLRPQKRLRFGWWGAEELGLIGSRYYADNLAAAERDKIDIYLNFDMVGQKDTTSWGVYSHTPAVAATFKKYFADRNIRTFDIRWDGSSDHSSFTRHGIPVSGIGSSDDPCYHSACDTISNVGPRAMGISTNAIAAAVWNLAGDDAPAENDFSVSVSPAAGDTDPGGSVSATVATATVKGQAQPVQLSATGLPDGAQAGFDPQSVTSGESSALTISTSASTPPGAYPITITGTGDEVTRSTTFTLTVNGTAPTGCQGHETTKTGDLTTGRSDYQPDGSYFYTGTSGRHQACLDGPAGTDYDLYLQKWSGAGWTTVAQSTSPGPDEELTYNGTSGYYRYRIHAYNGNGTYTLGYDAP
jgi:aminopeptidase S